MKNVVTLRGNGMKMIQDDGDTLLVVCAETDELCVLKQVKKVNDFGMSWRGKLYECAYNFSASLAVEKLQEFL